MVHCFGHWKLANGFYFVRLSVDSIFIDFMAQEADSISEELAFGQFYLLTRSLEPTENGYLRQGTL